MLCNFNAPAYYRTILVAELRKCLKNKIFIKKKCRTFYVIRESERASDPFGGIWMTQHA